MKILSVDVGGTYTKFAVLNEKAKFFEQGKIDTPKESHEDFLQMIEKLFRNYEVEGIALSLPGIIDTNRGLCITSGTLGYNDGKFIVAELEKICGVKISLENDANCAAIAEAKIGSLSDVEDGFVMVFGTMIGGAFIKNHKIHRGKNFLSGEVSFMFDSLGKKFFWQNSSVYSLLKNYATTKNLSEKVSGRKFFQAVEENDFDAVNCLENFTYQIARQIFNIQMILDPEKFAIGGGISEQKIFIEKIRENLQKVYSESPTKFPTVEVVPCKFHNDANLIGALFRWLE